MNYSTIVMALRANMKLGWDQEGNWAPPLLYLLVALIAPISGVLMLVFMYLVVMGGSADRGFLAFLIAGSAMFLFIRLVLAGAGNAVVEDREHYKMLRYVYIAPVHFPLQIAGRIAVKLLVALVGMTATIASGYLFLGLHFRADGIQWGTFFGALFVGLVGLGGISVILAGIMLIIDRMGWVWAEGISGLMFLAAGAVIPMALLPAPMEWFGRTLPMSYWADLWRHALYGAGSAYTLPGLSPSSLWRWLIGSTAAWAVLSAVSYNICDLLARRWGRVERETFY